MPLNWPEVALGLGLVALLVFRAPLSRLIERTEKVRDWLVAPKQPSVPASADRSLPTRSPSDEQKALEKLTGGFNSQLLLMQEESIRADLAQHQLSAETTTEKVLLRHLAGTQIALHFERTYAVIYRSQLQALRWLNAQSAGVDAGALQPFFQQGVQAWPVIHGDGDFRAWLRFMGSHGLITESEQSALISNTADPFGIVITVLGREFLAFLVNGGRADPSVG